MPAQRKKKVNEPATSDVLLDNDTDTVDTSDNMLVETVEAALDQAVKNISALQESVGSVTTQVSTAKEELVSVATDLVTQQVASVTEQASRAKEELVSAANDLVTQQVDSVTEQVNMAKDAVVSKALNMASGVQDIIVQLASKSMSEMLVEAMNNKTNIKVLISKNAQNMILSIASSMPDVLENIKKSLLEVVKDGKIDASDFPHFISIIQDLYEIVCRMKDFKFDNQTKATICAEVLKYISHFMAFNKLIQIERMNQDLFLSQIDCLIDSCVSLLSFPAAIKLPSGCLPFLCK
ncbi:MAG: hypothetical protein MUP82_09560 [Candidatus Marinimicrobia bacterium]|nr:hypothetical protein [Candidatus Neomarinimicrobiota bacterium]